VSGTGGGHRCAAGSGDLTHRCCRVAALRGEGTLGLLAGGAVATATTPRRTASTISTTRSCQDFFADSASRCSVSLCAISMFELSGTDRPSRRECVSRGYQQGRSQPSSLVLVVRGDGGCQHSHDFGGYRVGPGRLHDGCMVRPANHDHAWVFVGFYQFNTERVTRSDNLATG